MKVIDYYNDMILNQKWAVEVETICVHTCVDEPFEDIATNTYYFTVPCGKCKYFNYDVRYFRIINDTIYLSIKDYDEV